MKRTFALLLPAVFALAPVAEISAHCQVPCGIYDDNNVINSMHTDWVTIEKAAKQIDELSKDPSANAHQLTRWIMNKESHAQAIQDKVLNYFLAQRLKPDADGYVEKLKLCHEVIVTAMKCKQSTDAANVEALHDLMHKFEDAFGEKEEK
ncbi:superoxide dismutase [Haloferula helveola]|uniref:Superoxide dismutase n=1 Tax=Haloferula helveola TaxID=490095 RepID=A0ABM7REA0_9BACT|nr:superoxide dismutase [Haloferula helveola]